MNYSTVPQSKLAFIVSKFPCYDEAFILRELDALSRKREILIFSLKESNEKVIHDEAKRLLPNTIYLPNFFSSRLLSAHFLFLFRNPLKYFRAFFHLVFGNLKSPEFLIKNIVLFPKAVYMARQMEIQNVGHIHAYWATYPASVALVISELTQIPYSLTGHAHDIYLNTTHLDTKIERAKFVSTCTSQNKDYLRKIAPNYAEEKILVNYHGLDLEKFWVNGKKRNETFEILSVGTLNPHKGFQYFLDSLAILKNKNLHFHATIIGGGPLELELKAKLKELNLEKTVTMTGALKQSDVIPYYKKADLVVLMAQGEWHWGIPNVLIEALAAKAAVITTRFGSVEELVQEEKTGILVPAKDPAALASAIEKFYSDETYRLRLVESGHQLVVKNFDIHKNIETFIQGFSK